VRAYVPGPAKLALFACSASAIAESGPIVTASVGRELNRSKSNRPSHPLSQCAGEGTDPLMPEKTRHRLNPVILTEVRATPGKAEGEVRASGRTPTLCPLPCRTKAFFPQILKSTNSGPQAPSPAALISASGETSSMHQRNSLHSDMLSRAAAHENGL
jgi:hypothetical protein